MEITQCDKAKELNIINTTIYPYYDKNTEPLPTNLIVCLT